MKKRLRWYPFLGTKTGHKKGINLRDAKAPKRTLENNI